MLIEESIDGPLGFRMGLRIGLVDGGLADLVPFALLQWLTLELTFPPHIRSEV